ncbi:cation diffusion facilitator family transporter [uncultured Dialister sp.]|jgi:cation diffusion facilitator family transporter|uniref:cation diffusion facilitator family transporter n=1 Tax=Dialister sp. TaxID=1955814 RepID=UPI0025EC9DC0|nr:cation diffusion facilitator family transporter [uncultured Dialister sp.]
MTFLFVGPRGERTKKAFLAGSVGLFVNFLLGFFKILAGWQSGFLSVVGDGFNNITDMGSVILLMMTFYYAAKPSDKEHPFGHGRLEYINSTVMAAVILYVGITLLVQSVQKIMHPEDTTFTPFVAVILLVGLVGKLFLAWWYKRAGKKLNSHAFDAYSADSLSDMLSTSGVLVATLVEYFFGLHIDGYVGTIMALFILWTGYGIMKNAVNSILGATPDAEVYKKIRECILSCPGVYGVHDLIVHDYGPENHFCTAHVELDSSLDLVESHELAENVMTTLREKLNVQATIHADPKAVSNPREEGYRRDLESAIYRSKLPLSYHDFFVEERNGEIHLSFELALTGPCRLDDKEIYEKICECLQEINPAFTVETMVDRNFISGKVYGADKEEVLQIANLEKNHRILRKKETGKTDGDRD